MRLTPSPNPDTSATTASPAVDDLTDRCTALLLPPNGPALDENDSAAQSPRDYHPRGLLGEEMADSHVIEAPVQAEDAALVCYRHPDRETFIRCGRCDRPICLKCAVQGPVGFRCRDCGLMKNDPLTSFAPAQLVLAIGVSLIAGAVAGVVAGQIGIFSILVSYFAGGLVVEAVRRVVGYKHGPVMLGIVFGGIIAGAFVGLGYEYWTLVGSIPPQARAAVPLGPVLQQEIIFALISAAAACAGAYSRLR
jgi:hypothetical protein